MAVYVIVFKKPAEPGSMVPPTDTKPVTSIKDYQDITKVFRSKLLASDKVICSHNVKGDETEIIYDTTLENKRKVCFTGIKFTGSSLRREVPVDKLDQDTVVYFIDGEEILQNVINRVSDGDVISLIQDTVVDSPLTCPDDKKVVIDLCGSNIICNFDGEATSSPNITIKNSIESQGIIRRQYSVVNKGNVLELNPITQSAADVIALANDGDIVVLPAGEYGDINVSKGITISAKYDETTDTFEDVVLGGTITVCAEEGYVEINRVTIKGATSPTGTGATNTTAVGSAITVVGGCDFAVRGCTIENISNFYNIIRVETAGIVALDDITFEKNDCYNAVEFGGNTLVKNGTSVKGCVFKEGCCTHCAVSMFSFDNKAVVTFSNNVLDTDDNAFRFSNTNNATATIKMLNNVWKKTAAYDATEVYDAKQCGSKYYAGLFFFQKYIDVMDFSTMTVIATNNKFNDKVVTAEYAENAEDQLYYVYMNKPTWVMTKPVVKITE